MTTTRRQFLTQTSALSTLAAMGISGSAQPLHASQSASEPEHPATTLRAAGAARGILVGCAVKVRLLRDTPEYAALVREHAGILVEENAMKFARLRPSPTTYFFDDADYLVQFAEANKMKVRGHNFVWCRELPQWFESYVTKANAEQVLVEHIEHVAGRYAGKIHSWDVVNEAIHLEDGLPDGMRDFPWQKLLPGYLDIAYRTARRVDPKALLVYNDYGIEGEDEGSKKKRIAVMQLLKGMQKRGVPLDGVGIQSHLSAGPKHVYGAGLQAFIAEAHQMGLKILLTEMDVNDRDLPADIPARDAGVADTYGRYLQTALNHSPLEAVLTWGITDRYTWLNSDQSRSDKLPERCLPFDADLQPTLAFAAMVQALRATSKS